MKKEIKKNPKRFQLAAVALIFLGILAAGVFAFGFHGMHGGQFNNATQAAIASDDYAAFNTALAGQNRSVNITQDQFEKIVTRQKQGATMRTALQDAQTAVKNNDFAAWQAAMGTVAKNQTSITQDRFNTLVQEYQSRQKVQQAIAGNDYNAWKQAMTDAESARLTQDNFNRIVAAYQAHGNQTGPMGNGMVRGGMMRGRGFGLKHR